MTKLEQLTNSIVRLQKGIKEIGEDQLLLENSRDLIYTRLAVSVELMIVNVMGPKVIEYLRIKIKE